MAPIDPTFDPSPVHHPLPKALRGRSLPSGWIPNLTGIGALSLTRHLAGIASVLGLVLIGLTCLFAAWHLPWALVLAWPLYLVASAPYAFVVAANLTRERFRSSLPPMQERAAAEWVTSRVAALGLSSVRVICSYGMPSFYAPEAKVIGLTRHLYRERTSEAYATAAHELGHAWIDARAPRRAAVAQWFRQYADSASRLGLGMLFGVAMTGARSLLPLAFVVLSAAMLARFVIAIEEAAASALALRELRASGMMPARVHDVRRHLAWALSTYVAHAVGHTVPLLLAPWLCTFFGDGLLTPGAGQDALTAQVCTILAWGLVATGGIVFVDTIVSLVIRRTSSVSTIEAVLGGIGVALSVALTLASWHQPAAQQAPVIAALAGSVVWVFAYWPVAGLVVVVARMASRLQKTAERSSGTSPAELIELVEKLAPPLPPVAPKLFSYLWVLAPALPLALRLLG